MKVRIYFSTSVFLTLAFWLISAASCSLSAAESQARFVAIRYTTFDAFPLDFFYKPVGTAKNIFIYLPPTVNLGNVPMAILDLSVEDIDASKEVQIFINGHGPIQPPADTVVPELKTQGYLLVPTAFLKPGGNEFKFVFADNLNFTTDGFTIEDASLLLLPDITQDREKTAAPPQAKEILLGKLGTVLVVESLK